MGSSVGTFFNDWMQTKIKKKKNAATPAPPNLKVKFSAPASLGTHTL